MRNRTNFVSVVFSVFASVLFVAVAVSASTTISTNISTGGTLTVSGNTTLGDSASNSVTATAYFTQVRIGTGSTFGHISTVGADELGVEGDVEVDGTAWFDGILQASSTALFGSTVTVTGLTSLGFASTSAITTGTLMVSGRATTTASNGKMLVSGTMGVGTTTDSTASEISVDGAATTTLLINSSATTKGACIQLSSGTTAYRLYATTSGVAVWEQGPCK